MRVPRFAQRPAARMLLLAALPFVAYANGYHHAWQLDDHYTLVTNPHVRRLAEIPRYFVDPGTYTSVREQADYRPVLQVTYALNYAPGGYEMPWWHFTQIVLHALVTLGIFALCRRVLTLSGGPVDGVVSFVVAALFAVHPAASGVVNYVNARSSLLTAALLLPALLAYMHRIDRDGYARPQWRTALFYALALFSKVEAVGALGALWAFELWQRGRESSDGLAACVFRTFDRRTLRRVAPLLAVTAIYFVIRWRVMAPFPFEAARHAADVGAREYLLTQFTAWWYYVARWVAPVALVADDLAYPVYRSLAEPVVLLALGGWLLVGAALVASWRKSPELLFLGVAALALISPTSSVAPLAEMVNEHRPYLPMGVLSLAMIIPLGARAGQLPGLSRGAFGVGLIAVAAALSLLTWRRNQVFQTEERYWRDVLDKAPSARAHLNYGLSLMQRGDFTGALRHYDESLAVAPNWYFTHINIAIAYQSLGQPDRAREHYDRAVANDLYSGQALLWRGEFHLAQREFMEARDDFLRAWPTSLQRYRSAKGLATAYAALGHADSTRIFASQMRALDSAAAERDIPAVTTAAGRPLADTPATESQRALMEQGLGLLRRGDPAGAATVFRRLIAVNPTHYGAHYQLAAALDRSGRDAEARPVWEQVLRMAESYRDAATITTVRARLSRNP